jgi:hypothetical protein
MFEYGLAGKNVPEVGPGIGGRHTFVKDGEQAAKQTSGAPMASSGDRKESASLGNALRAVYQDAIGESVPDEMLDLLNKLK